MFTQAEKDVIIENNLPFKRKGMETNELIGQRVLIDWDLNLPEGTTGGANFISEFSPKLQRWINQQSIFLITDVRNWGLSSTITLDHRFEVSIFRAYNPETGRYTGHFESFNGNGFRALHQ